MRRVEESGNYGRRGSSRMKDGQQKEYMRCMEEGNEQVGEEVEGSNYGRKGYRR